MNIRWYVNVDSTGVIVHNSNCPPDVLAWRHKNKVYGGWEEFATEVEAWEYAKSRSRRPKACGC